MTARRGNITSPLCISLPMSFGKAPISSTLSVDPNGAADPDLKELFAKPESIKCSHPSIASLYDRSSSGSFTLRMLTFVGRHSKSLSETADLSHNTGLWAKPTRSWHMLFQGICTTRNAACGMWSCPNSTFQVITKPSVLFCFCCFLQVWLPCWCSLNALQGLFNYET